MRKIFWILIVVFLVLSQCVLAENALYYNGEKAYFADEDGHHHELPFLTKIPKFLLRTRHPQRYLAVYPFHSEALILFDTENNVVLNQMKLAYMEPWLLDSANGEDFHFLSKSAGLLEIFSYNVSTTKVERLECPGQTPLELKVSPDNRRAFALVEEWGLRQRKLVTIELNPLRIHSITNVSSSTSRIFPISSRHVAVLDFGIKYPRYYKNSIVFDIQEDLPGSLIYFDVEQAKMEYEFKFQSRWRYSIKWQPMNNTLVMLGVISHANFRSSRSQFEYNGESVVGRLSEQGMFTQEIPALIWEYEYEAQKDKLYITMANRMEVIDCTTKSTIAAANVGPNIFQAVTDEPEKTVYRTRPYRMIIYPEKNRLVSYNIWNGDVRVIDLNALKMIRRLKAGRIRDDIKSFIGDERTIVVSSKNLSHTYTFEQGAKKIRIYDEFLNEVDVLSLRSKPLAMYAVGDTPVIITDKELYKITERSMELIRRFEQPISKVNGFTEGNMILTINGCDRLILDVNTCKEILYIRDYATNKNYELAPIFDWRN